MRFIAVYIRCSTASQNEASQRREIESWLNGNSVDRRNVKFYVDIETGDHLNRPAFEKLESDIFQGLVHTVVCYKLDRLSRSLRDGINVLCNWCDRGIRVVSTSQQIDFNGTVGKLIASILFAVSEMEQDTRRERQAAGIAAAKEKGGVYTGRKKGATKKGVDTDRAVELRKQGLKQEEIAQALGVSLSSVRRYLRQKGQAQ
jgi:DNA invertase Pin-like site-specific DNA recombinase